LTQKAELGLVVSAKKAAMIQKQRYGRNAKPVPDFLDDRIDWERDCDYSTGVVVGAMS
jgi:hypothetical protein